MNKHINLFLLLIGSCFGDTFVGEEIEIKYRGGNGAYSPDRLWYANLWDGINKETGELYFRFQIFSAEGTNWAHPNPTFDPEGKTPRIDILIPFENINVRGMKLIWSEDSKLFTADQGWAGIFTYNLSTNNFSKTKK